MKSYTTMRNLYGTLTNDSTSGNLTLGDQLMNDTIRRIIASWNFDFVEKKSTLSTVASQQFYELPYDYEKLISVTVTIGSTTYTPKEVGSREEWDFLNQTTQTSDIPGYYFIFNRQLGFFPKPSSVTTNAITFVYKRGVRDLSVADYTTGTITTATNGGTGITGSGTTFHAGMAGRFIRITDGNAANSGDHFWYEISSVTSATVLVLVRNYGGTSIAAGSANYTIGQMSLLPEPYDVLPVYDAAVKYFLSKKLTNIAREYQAMYNDLYTQLKLNHGTKTTGQITTESEIPLENPNLFYSV